MVAIIYAKMLYLVHCCEIVENALKFIVLHSISNHDELFQKQQDVSSDGKNVFLLRSWSVCEEITSYV